MVNWVSLGARPGLTFSSSLIKSDAKGKESMLSEKILRTVDFGIWSVATGRPWRSTYTQKANMLFFSRKHLTSQFVMDPGAGSVDWRRPSRQPRRQTIGTRQQRRR